MTLSEKITNTMLILAPKTTNSLMMHIWTYITCVNDNLGRPITGKKRVMVWDAVVRKLRHPHFVEMVIDGHSRILHKNCAKDGDQSMSMFMASLASEQEPDNEMP